MKNLILSIAMLSFFVFNFSSCCGPCSSITDKVTERIQEEVAEEVQERIIEEASGGEVDIEIEDSIIIIRGEDGEEIVMDMRTDEEGGILNITGPEGEVRASGDISEYDIDENLLYPDANDVFIISLGDEGLNLYQISANLDDDYDAVLDYYTNLRKWRVEQKVIQTDGAYLTLINKNNDNIIAQIILAKEEEGTVGLGVVYSEDKD